MNKVRISVEAGDCTFSANRTTEKTVAYLHSVIDSPKVFRECVSAMADEVMKKMAEKENVELVIVAYPAKD